MKPSEKKYAIEPIGIIRSSFKTKEESPIQGVLTNSTPGSVEIFEQYEAGLKDIDGFSHIYLLYIFDRAEEIRLVRKPFLDDSKKGLFATRHPCRPNYIGFTIVRLISRNGRFLQIEGIDTLDKTPLVDIKPYVKKFDSFPESEDGWLEKTAERPKPSGRE